MNEKGKPERKKIRYETNDKTMNLATGKIAKERTQINYDREAEIYNQGLDAMETYYKPRVEELLNKIDDMKVDWITLKDKFRDKEAELQASKAKVEELEKTNSANFECFMENTKLKAKLRSLKAKELNTEEIKNKIKLELLPPQIIINELSTRIGKPNYKPNYEDSRSLNLVYKQLIKATDNIIQAIIDARERKSNKQEEGEIIKEV